MIQNNIQPFQLFVLMVLFEVGSSVVVGLGLEAKQDAWLAILLGLLGGLVLFSLYIYLYIQFPDLSMINYLELIVGKMIGRLLAVIYICLFLYIAARVLRTFCELVLITILVETPILVIAIMFMAVICFACYLGFEVIARTAEIFFFWVMFFSFLFILFILISGLPKLENLQPVLEGGWQPIWKAAFPTIFSFPFGESIVFTIFFRYLNSQKQGVISGFLAMIFSGMILLIATTVIISVLGPFAAKISSFPLLVTVEKINIGDVFQRLDPIALIMLIIGGFFKITIFFLGAIEGISNLINKDQMTKYTIPILGTAVIALSILMAPNYIEHAVIGNKIIPKYVYIPLFMVVPFLLVVIVFLKKKWLMNK